MENNILIKLFKKILRKPNSLFVEINIFDYVLKITLVFSLFASPINLLLGLKEVFYLSIASTFFICLFII
ncbi:MAG: hypothetical protein OHK0038_17680 [Flammeovirgaceae bacterium]